jgi:hypothetical protein
MTSLAAAAAFAGAQAVEPQGDNDAGLILLVVIGAVLLAVNAGKAKTGQPTAIEDADEADDGK